MTAPVSLAGPATDPRGASGVSFEGISWIVHGQDFRRMGEQRRHNSTALLGDYLGVMTWIFATPSCDG